MIRLVHLALLVMVAALAAPAAASAAPRMWMGFQDDPYFRWLPDRFYMRDRAVHANATVMKTTVYWFNTAPRRPANAASPFDPAYRWEDIDEFVRQAADRDMEVMLTIWGTPAWAGPARNRAPRRLADLTNFSRAMATRYSGRYPGLPFVRFYSVWNEPNLQLFLAPQYAGKRSVAPRIYAAMHRAAYAGFKAGSRLSQVAIGETSPRRLSTSPSHAPATFMQLVAKTRPKVKFDAWAHHPYGSPASAAPTQRVGWPNVGMSSLPRFGTALDKAFGRKNVPLWLTEYGHETRPEDPRGVTYARQAAYLRSAVNIARRNPRVAMLIWFVMRDNPVNAWQSGLLTEFGLEKPSFDQFSVLARLVDARNAYVTVKGGRANPVVRVPTTKFAYRSGVGSRVGFTYKVFQGARLLRVEQPVVRIARDGWISFRPRFTPARGRTYRLQLELGDVNGNKLERRITLIGVK